MIDQAEIHNMAQSKIINERKEAVNQLCSNFKYLNDKEQAWQDLIQLMQDEDLYVRELALKSLKPVFDFIPNNYKVQAWEKLMQYINAPYIDNFVLNCVVEVLGYSFSSLPDNYKIEGWQKLVRLTENANNNVRSNLVVALDLAREHIPVGYKVQAWEDYDRLSG